VSYIAKNWNRPTTSRENLTHVVNPDTTQTGGQMLTSTDNIFLHKNNSKNPPGFHTSVVLNIRI
jgi:hypothetical protein